MSIYDKKTAIHFQNILAGIDNLWSIFPELSDVKYKESNLTGSEGEYGFYLKSKEKKTELFIGLWMEYWVDFGIPCVITLETTSYEIANAKKELEKMLIEFPNFFEKTHIYDGTIVIPVKEEFIVNFENHELVVNKIVEFAIKSGYYSK